MTAADKFGIVFSVGFTAALITIAMSFGAISEPIVPPPLPVEKPAPSAMKETPEEEREERGGAVGEEKLLQSQKISDFECPNLTPGLPEKLKPATADDAKKVYDVIIIGAGVSGLEALHELALEGKNDIIVLEARDRIGGRTHTVFDENGVAFDYGGSWIHGHAASVNGTMYSNPLWKIVQSNNISFSMTQDGSTDYSTWEQYRRSNGIQNPADNQTHYDKIIEELPESYQDEFSNLEDTYHRNKGIKELKKIIEIYNDTEGDPLPKKDPILFNHMMEWMYEQEYAADIENMSSEAVILDQYYLGDEYAENIFPDGYIQIAKCLASNLEDKIKQATVEGVNYENEIIIVDTDRGEFKARHVISTIPLGVMKELPDEFWQPRLPDDKQKSIKALEMGTMDKVYIIFNNIEKPFWDSTDTYPTYIHRVADGGENEKYPDTWKVYLNLYPFTNKNILLAFHVGSTAIDMETKNETQLKAEVTEVLKAMYPNADIPEPEIRRTQWAKDNFAYGSYSYVPVGGTTDDFDVIAEPVEKKIFFAGEATTRCSFGTVHGAYISGYRAAQEILELKENEDQMEEQLEHGVQRWELVGKEKPTKDMIPEICGGTKQEKGAHGE